MYVCLYFCVYLKQYEWAFTYTVFNCVLLRVHFGIFFLNIYCMGWDSFEKQKNLVPIQPWSFTSDQAAPYLQLFFFYRQCGPWATWSCLAQGNILAWNRQRANIPARFHWDSCPPFLCNSLNLEFVLRVYMRDTSTKPLPGYSIFFFPFQVL